MENKKRLIDANELVKHKFRTTQQNSYARAWNDAISAVMENAPTVDAVEVVRCQNCVHAEPLDRNCELSTTHYLHCKLWRGEETKNVWHKYKKYYKDYSLVERDGYCDAGAKMDGGNEDGNL